MIHVDYDETDEGSRTRVGRDPFESAKEKGLDVFVADDLTLQLDLDGPEAVAAWVDRLAMFANACAEQEAPLPWVEPILTTTSKSGKGKHVYLHLRFPMTLSERVALQSALGSDTKRDALSILRGYLHDDASPTVCLFEVPGAQADSVRTWLDLWAPQPGKLPNLAPDPKLLTDGSVRDGTGRFVAPGFKIGQTGDVVVLDE